MGKPARLLAALGTVAAVAVALAGCSSDDNKDSGSGRVTLIVGDQVHQTESLLKASGQLDNLPYDIKWTTFESGPPLLEAAAANKIDVGGTGDVPVLLAQAGGAALKVIGVQADTKSNDFLLVPQGSKATSISDLKGKKIAVTQGSSSHGLLLGLLKKAGLSIKDVTPTFLSPPDALAAFSAGQVDAWAVWNPYATVGVAQAKGKIIADGTGITTNQVYFTASQKTLDDSKKVTALKDLLSRIGKSLQWGIDHRDQWVPTFAKLTNLPEQVAGATFDTSQGVLVPIGKEQTDKQQGLADLFLEAGLIKKQVTAADYFDDQFNSAVPAAS